MLADYARFEEEAAASPFNRYADAEDKSLGIIACGIAYNYLAENYPDGCPHPVLKISQYPLPQELVRRMASECKALLIIEEGQPVVEEALRGILPAPVEIRGRMSGELPRTGELLSLIHISCNLLYLHLRQSPYNTPFDTYIQCFRSAGF